jgi:hypothetical protein
MATCPPASPDRLNRVILVAVELVDPVTLSRAVPGVSVSAQGLAGRPIVNLSGRFVWLAEGEAWPTTFTIDPGNQPYERENAYPAPPRPADLLNASSGERLARITLRPTAAYPFSDGVTAVRGSLRETPGPKSAAVADAEVWIRWADDAPTGPVWLDAPVRTRTNRAGDFAAFLRLPSKARPAVENGKLRLRIAVSRAGQIRQKAARVPDGRVYDLPDTLAWSALRAV